jgi:para-nitrobenzyl esterase
MTQVCVNTTFGQVLGKKEGKVYAWKGIPYAKPPVGERRFLAPIDPEPWEDVRDATEFGPIACQPEREIMTFLGAGMANMSEDCLYLNVWSPGSDERRRPVLVWIHGGAFMSGSGSAASYTGVSFAELGDVVVVTFNYRLGVLGFLHLGEVAGAGYETSGNNGMLDQIAALNWVRDNIEFFGGDPDRVTIFGESAGAMSVATLLAMPQAKGLFQQAILQSGAARNTVTATQATQIAKKVLESIKIEGDLIEQLVDLPVEQLIAASDSVPHMHLVPVVDGLSLPLNPEAAIAQGCAKDIPILIGTNKDEYNLFTLFDPRFKEPVHGTLTSLCEKVFGPLWPSLASHFLQDKEISTALFNKLMTLLVFYAPATNLAEEQVKQGAPVWMYRFDWESPVLNGGLKSCHALEIPFVWNNLTQPGTSNLVGVPSTLKGIALQMHQAWIAFAHHGNPNTPELPAWPAYDLENRTTMLFDEDSQIENDPEKESRVAWEKAVVIS